MDIAFDEMPIIIKLIVEPIIDPNLTNFPAIISVPGIIDENAETTDEYNKTKNTALVVSKDLNL